MLGLQYVLPWLQHTQAIIDFELREIAFNGGKFPKLLDVLKETNLITTEIGDEDELFSIHVRQTTKKTDIQGIEAPDSSNLARNNLQEFSDVFQEELDTSLHPEHLQG